MSETSPKASAVESREPLSPAFDRRQRIALVIIVVAAIIAGLLAARYNPLLTHAASREGSEIDALFGHVFGVAVAILVIVEGSLIFVIVRFGIVARSEARGVPIRDYLPLEILWTAIPFMIVTWLAVRSYQVMVSIGTVSPQAYVVEVRARQFAWEFDYPGTGVSSNELHIPLGRQILFRMHSADVIHSFWVPDFRIKRDVMPDRITEMEFTATQLGTFPLLCSRLCGVGHAFMRSNVVVQTSDDFQAWLTQQAKAQSSTTDPAAYGRSLFAKYGCSGCHTLSDAGATGQVGPNLNGIGVRAAERVPGQSAGEYIRTSIINPNAYIVPGYPANVMPQDFQQRMSSQELDGLVNYLLMQQEP